MGIGRYLPSAQFFLIVVSLAVSFGLVWGAQRLTGEPAAPARITSAPTPVVAADWQKELQNIQAQNPLYTLPESLSAASVGELLGAAQSENVTDTVGRTLLINLTNAGSQGLGSDLPTQEELIAAATQQIVQGRTGPLYVQNDLTLVPEDKTTLRAYGNAMMKLLIETSANADATYIAIGYAIDYRDSTYLEPLAAIGEAYETLGADMAVLPVPTTLAPLHLQVVNNFANIAALYPDLKTAVSDPLRGLAALQLYQSLLYETSRVFTTVASQLSKNGILFTDEEPGSAWSAFSP